MIRQMSNKDAMMNGFFKSLDISESMVSTFITTTPNVDDNSLKVIQVNISNENTSSSQGNSEVFLNTIAADRLVHSSNNASEYCYCSICGNGIESEYKDSFCNVFDEENLTLHSRQGLLQALMKILSHINGDIILQLLCKECLLLLNEWDNFHSKALNYQSMICEKYKLLRENVANKSAGTTNSSLEISSETMTLEDQGISFDDPEYIPYSYIRTKKARDSRKRRDSQLPSTSEDSQIKIVQQLNSEEGIHQDYFCKNCNYLAKTESEYEKHNAVHTCHICGLFITLPRLMNHHMRKIHGMKKGKKDFTCKVCGKKYASSGSLYNHTKTAHSDVTYLCDICGQKFRHVRLLDIHKIRHKGKSVKCKECDAMFHLTTELNKHINQVHLKVKPYKCYKCGKFFCQRSVLNHHLSQHVDTNKSKESACPVYPSKSIDPEQEIMAKSDWSSTNTPVESEELIVTKINTVVSENSTNNMQTFYLSSVDSCDLKLNEESSSQSSSVSFVNPMGKIDHIDSERSILFTSGDTIDLVEDEFREVSIENITSNLSENETTEELVLNSNLQHDYELNNLNSHVNSLIEYGLDLSDGFLV